MKLHLPRFICSAFYHRFGYKTDHCVRCGISSSKADGIVVDSKYDNHLHEEGLLKAKE